MYKFTFNDGKEPELCHGFLVNDETNEVYLLWERKDGGADISIVDAESVEQIYLVSSWQTDGANVASLPKRNKLHEFELSKKEIFGLVSVVCIAFITAIISIAYFFYSSLHG